MATANITFRIDEELKAQLQEYIVCGDLQEYFRGGAACALPDAPRGGFCEVRACGGREA